MSEASMLPAAKEKTARMLLRRDPTVHVYIPGGKTTKAAYHKTKSSLNHSCWPTTLLMSGHGLRNNFQQHFTKSTEALKSLVEMGFTKMLLLDTNIPLFLWELR